MGDDFNGIDVEKKNQQKSFQLLFDVMEFFSSPEINYSNHSIKISATFSSRLCRVSKKNYHILDMVVFWGVEY